MLQGEELKDAARLLVGSVFRGTVTAENTADHTGLGAAVTAEADVVEHAQLMKKGGALKGPDEPKLGQRAGFPARNVLAKIDDPAAGGRIEAADDVEGCGLAGTVRADQAVNRARVHVEAEIVDGDDAAKGANQIADLENRLLGWRHRRGCQHIKKRDASAGWRTPGHLPHFAPPMHPQISGPSPNISG